MVGVGPPGSSRSPTPATPPGPSSYDDLAVSALRFLADHAGEDAVADFAAARAADMEQRLRETLEQAPVAERPQALATALSEDGYAAGISVVPTGAQLCQHHCPVQHVAQEFPQLCEAETAMLSSLLGTHVQRLATIAHGDGVCTTHIPANTEKSAATPKETSTVPQIREDHFMTASTDQLEGLGQYKFGWSDADTYADDVKRGLNEAVVRDISTRKSEPEWMLDLRLKGLKLFERKPMPTWGSDLSGIDFDNIKYFVRSTEKQAATWDELPADIKATYDRLGIPEAEKQRLMSGVSRPSTSPRSSTTRSVRTSRSRASSSWTPTPRCASTRRSSRSTSAR